MSRELRTIGKLRTIGAGDRPVLRTTRGLMRLVLPYGKYICADGSEVFHNRHYQPLWRRRGDAFENVNPKEWIKFETQENFWNDSNPPWVSKKTKERMFALLMERFTTGCPDERMAAL